jgi:transcription elongation GreA/GreB family factor
MKARWDDLRRAIAAKDAEGAERIWLELIESQSGALDKLLAAAKEASLQQGGKRQAGLLLWMLAESLKEKGRDKDLIQVYCLLAGMGPDDGTLRTALIEAARRAHAGRSDLEGLLEKSGVLNGAATELGTQAQVLERYLRLEPETWVFHKSGWGAGQIKAYHPERGRCVIDFRTKAGHEMDIEAAATLLERLHPDDIRVLSMRDPAGLKSLAEERPEELVRQVLGRFSNAASLRHVKDALVPDAVSGTSWPTWWKSAKKRLLMDPRFQVGTGADPRLTFHEAASVDFKTQVGKTLKATSTTPQRQKAIRDMMATIGDESEAKLVLREAVENELSNITDPGLKLGWDLILADLGGRSRDEAVTNRLPEGRDDAIRQLSQIAVDDTRAAAARAALATRADGVDIVLAAALKDDPVVAEAGAEGFAAAKRPEMLQTLLGRIEAAPLDFPNLYCWYLKGISRSRWESRPYEPFSVVTRAIKGLDQIEYRARRDGAARDKKASQSFQDFLGDKNCRVMIDAAKATDDGGAAYLLAALEKNRGLKPRLMQKLQDVLLRAHPQALRAKAPAGVEIEPQNAPVQTIYMTRAGLERWKLDLDRITNVEMPANAAEIARAREFGDLRENAEYHAAREKQSLLQAKADMLRGDLARAVPITPEIVRTDAVSVGARVRVKDDMGREQTYTLWGPPDVDVEHGIINYLTPLGKALMGSRVGQRVRFEVDGAGRDLTILAIEPAPLG